LGLHLDGNTQTDLVLAAPRARRGSVLDVGAVHVIYDVQPGAEIELESTPGAVFTGSENKDQAGATIAAPGDVDGDGVIDLAISAVQPTGNKPGRVYLVNGSGGRLEDEAQTEMVGPATHNRMGDILAAAGDTDGDGVAEVVIGAASRTAPTVTLWWYADPADGVVQTDAASASLDGGTLVTLQAGVVDGAGDVNDDGYDDVWVGAPAFGDFGGDQEGAVYLFHGPISTDWALDSADAVVSGTAAGDHLGSSVTGGGDLDSDGIPDLIASADAGPGKEQIVVVYGGFTGSVDAPDATLGTDGGLRRLGQSLDAGGDIDGDGYLDAVFGAPGYTGDPASIAVLWGQTGL